MREAFRRDLKGIGADPSKCGPHSLRSGGATMSTCSGISDKVAGSRCKPQTYVLMTIWIEDFLFPNSLSFKPCKLLVSISPLPNTLFVTLYRGGSRQAFPNKLIWFSDAVLLFAVEWRQNMLFLTSELAN